MKWLGLVLIVVGLLLARLAWKAQRAASFENKTFLGIFIVAFLALALIGAGLVVFALL